MHVPSVVLQQAGRGTATTSSELKKEVEGRSMAERCSKIPYLYFLFWSILLILLKQWLQEWQQITIAIRSLSSTTWRSPLTAQTNVTHCTAMHQGLFWFAASCKRVSASGGFLRVMERLFPCPGDGVGPSLPSRATWTCANITDTCLHGLGWGVSVCFCCRNYPLPKSDLPSCPPVSLFHSTHLTPCSAHSASLPLPMHT